MRVADDDPVARTTGEPDPACPVDAWTLTHALSPRPLVRVSTVDATGTTLNAYTGHAPVDGPAPELPWAVYLAGRDQRFRLLALDLDAKTDPSPAHHDADVLSTLLDTEGIAHVVCRSGPSDGRHLWLALDGSVDAATAATLARLARHLCPSLDLAPLTNPATGCVRPPGAPHRDGGTSTVLQGDLATLTRPTTTPEQVRSLITRLSQLVDDNVTEPTTATAPTTPLPVDQHGHLYLPGARRALPPVSETALHDQAAAAGPEGAVTADASAVLWTVLVGAAAARWRHHDIAALLPTAPGLEHLRSARDRGHRRPRPADGPSSPTAVLRRQWRKAVQHVATTARRTGTDPTFDTRADQLTAHVRAVQARADATPGRWTRGAGPGDRRVLDVLCTLALHALSADLEADTRRVALLAGVGRETARVALQRLTRDGWIALTLPAAGPHGAHWSVTPPTAAAIHRDTTSDRSQADPRPAGAGAAERLVLLSALLRRTQDAAHDLFTSGSGLGHHLGNVYARTSHDPTTVIDLARATASAPHQLRADLQKLEAVGLVEHRGGRWRRGRHDVRDVLAQAVGVLGRLSDRAHRYRVERIAWAWWQAEHAWMTAPRRTHPSRRAGAGQLDLLPQLVRTGPSSPLGAHPRRPDGRADYRASRAAVAASLAAEHSPAIDHGTPRRAAA
ncbi:hypothetical protein [Aquipuribacter hungaricus]|uniref:Uncharacterized protein n=1 Tax=Aquipuribacter hungaricus TaxID=545624 RepID=A0ABV7WL18_9MICO